MKTNTLAPEVANNHLRDEAWEARERLEISRIRIGTWISHDDEPDKHYVCHTYRRAGGPTYHDNIAGPFSTLEEARSVGEAIKASGRYEESDESQEVANADL